MYLSQYRTQKALVESIPQPDFCSHTENFDRQVDFLFERCCYPYPRHWFYTHPKATKNIYEKEYARYLKTFNEKMDVWIQYDPLRRQLDYAESHHLIFDDSEPVSDDLPF